MHFYFMGANNGEQDCISVSLIHLHASVDAMLKVKSLLFLHHMILCVCVTEQPTTYFVSCFLFIYF